MTPRHRRRRRQRPRSLLPRILTIAAVTTALLVPAAQSRKDPSYFRIEDATGSASECNDLTYITGPMHDADVDRNGYLDKEEYVQFADALSGGYLADRGWGAGGFTSMPLSLQEIYLVLSCRCELYPDQPWGGMGCCSNPNDPGIRTDGTAPGETPTAEQADYLSYVCNDAGALILLASRRPTAGDAELLVPPVDVALLTTEAGKLPWENLPLGIQSAYATLGYDESTWNSGGAEPESYNTYWNDLSPEMKDAALFIGYKQESWDAGITTPGTASPASQNSDGNATSPEAYYDEWWADLPTDIRNAYAVLGYNETTWNNAMEPETNDMYWDQLSPEMQEAAQFIGYTQEAWDTTPAPTVSPAGQNAPANASTAEAPSSGISMPAGSPSPNSPSEAMGMNLGNSPAKAPTLPSSADEDAPANQAASPTPEELYYDEYWADLPPEIRDAYGVLGYNETAWNFGIKPESDDMAWDELSPEMQDAALSVGYTREAWDATTAPAASPGFVPAAPATPSVAGPQSDDADPMAPSPSAPETLQNDKIAADSPLEFQNAATPSVAGPQSDDADPMAPSPSAPETLQNDGIAADSPLEFQNASMIALPYTGEVPAGVDFVAILDGRMNASEIMEGTNNQVKLMMEESLLELSEIVIEEEFRGDVNANITLTQATASSVVKVRRKEPTRRREKERVLVVEGAESATVVSVEEVECPSGVSRNVTQCLQFSNSILLRMRDEPAVEEKLDAFEDAMLAKIADGWLVRNFDLDEALIAPPAPSPAPTPSRYAGDADSVEASEGRMSTEEPQSLSAGAIIAIVMMVLVCLFMTVFCVDRNYCIENGRSGPERRKKRRKLWMKFTSHFLFMIASALYLAMAVEDFKWAKELQTLPMWLRIADDDVSWMDYRLEEREAARAGGVRRMKNRELRMEEEEQALEAKAAQYKPPAISLTAAARLGYSGRMEAVAKRAKSLGRELQTPEELYYDEWWADLPPEIQEAYAVLGSSEAMWNSAIKAESDELCWDALSQEMKEAALIIGYTREAWDATLAPVASPTSATAQNVLSPVSAEAAQLDTIPGLASPSSTNTTIVYPVAPAEPTSAVATESDATDVPAEINNDEAKNAETVEAGYYDLFSWVQLPPHIQAAAAVLGYDQSLWDSENGMAWSEEQFWDELSPDVKEAAVLLGYDKSSWDGSEASENDDYVSEDDDYVFQVSSSDHWVSRYQIIYFFAALCFLFVGILDLMWQRWKFHILMVLAGAFGVLSAVFVEADIQLSNVFNCVSVHFFLLEAVALIGGAKRNAFAADAGNRMKRFLALADVAFVVGSFMDVTLSYFYLFDDTSDWDASLMIVSIIASLFWLICSFIYLGDFFREYREEKNMQYQRAEEGDRAGLARMEGADEEDNQYLWTCGGSENENAPKETFVEDSVESVRSSYVRHDDPSARWSI